MRYRVDVYAYCVMENHYHLLIQTQESNLSKFMHFLLSSYASYLSKKGWEGHIFGGRYNALLVDKEAYLLAVSRYIHLNPVAASIVKMPENYHWSSYSSYINNRETPEWLKKEWISEYFGPGYSESTIKYKEFVEEGINNPLIYPDDKIISRTILGGIDFAEKIFSKVGKELNINDVIGKKVFTKRLTLNGLYQVICDYYELANLEIASAGDNENARNARRAFIFLAREYTTSSNGEISRMMGDISNNGVSLSFKRTEKLLEADEQFQEEFEREINLITSNIRINPNS